MFDALRIAALSGFAIAQPMFDLLGRSAEFLVAHRLSPAGILILAAALSLGVPAILVAIELAAACLGPRIRRNVHLLLVFGLSAAVAAPLVNRVLELPAAGALTAVAAAGLAAALAYSKLATVRSFLTVLSPSVLVFPVLFLALTPARGLTFPTESGTKAEQTERSPVRPVPIVFLIFDEFEAGALLDADKNIDSVRFPNFSALAGGSWWFPSATTVWTETQKAVPAILTGLRPKRREALPTYHDHPDNLFTWLRGSYGFNVNEPLTSLCPKDVCAPKAGEPAFEADVLLSDLVILYLHVLLPPSLSERFLPPMNATWKGFASGPETGTEAAEPVVEGGRNFGARFMKAATGDRRLQVRSFIESIRAEPRNTLHFLHVLLPHKPYTYLPSGTRYERGGASGLVDSVWVNDDLLPKVNYQRYLLQVGAVDGLIGDLVRHLKAIDLYDSALIVVTADHGRSFRPGHRSRSLGSAVRENASEILQVPLFMKLPGQTEGIRSERPVLTVDILPTIAEVLGAELPWKTDGTSMIGPSFPSRDTLEIASADGAGEPMRFSAAELTSYPHLSWKVENFGSRTPLDRLAIADPFNELVGRAVADIGIGPEATDLQMKPETVGAFGDVDPASGEVPVLLQGAISTPTTEKAPLRIAIAVNDIVRVTTRTAEWSNSPFYVSALIPEPAFKAGHNAIDVYKIDVVDGTPRLHLIPLPHGHQYRLDRNGNGEMLVAANGKILPIRADALRGHLDRIRMNDQVVSLGGWGADPRRLVGASTVVVFMDGKQVYSGKPSRRRADVVKFFGGASGVLESGFSVSIRRRAGDRLDFLRVFVLGDDAAIELVPQGGWKAAVDANG